MSTMCLGGEDDELGEDGEEEDLLDRQASDGGLHRALGGAAKKRRRLHAELRLLVAHGVVEVDAATHLMFSTVAPRHLAGIGVEVLERRFSALSALGASGDTVTPLMPRAPADLSEGGQYTGKAGLSPAALAACTNDLLGSASVDAILTPMVEPDDLAPS